MIAASTRASARRSRARYLRIDERVEHPDAELARIVALAGAICAGTKVLSTPIWISAMSPVPNWAAFIGIFFRISVLRLEGERLDDLPAAG